MSFSTEELFQTIELIVKNNLKKETSTDTIVGTIKEKIKNSDSYLVDYQGVDIVAYSLGSLYKLGEKVFVLLPKGQLNDAKFILGGVNHRTPTIVKDDNGLSDETLGIIQDIIDEFGKWGSQGYLGPSDKSTLALQWSLIQSSYKEIHLLAEDYPDSKKLEAALLELDLAYSQLEEVIEPLLEDMNTTSYLTEEESTELNNRLGKYLQKDRECRYLLQEELRDEILYKVDIFSSKGNTFKNGVVDTQLSIFLTKGKEDLTKTLKDSQVRWTKIDRHGQEDYWSDGTKEKHSITLNVSEKEVETKAIFKVEITIEDRIVAMNTITIVSVEDGRELNLSLLPSLGTQQISNNLGFIIPDYEEKSQVIEGIVSQNGLDFESDDLTFTWEVNFGKGFQPIEGNKKSGFRAEKNKLFVEKNLTFFENPVILIMCSVETEDKEYNISLKTSETITLSMVRDGEDPVIVSIVGNPVMNSSQATPTWMRAKAIQGKNEINLEEKMFGEDNSSKNRYKVIWDLKIMDKSRVSQRAIESFPREGIVTALEWDEIPDGENTFLEVTIIDNL